MRNNYQKVTRLVKFWIVIIIALFSQCTELFAQTFTLAGGSTGSHLYNLVYTWYQAPRNQRMAFHIPQAQINAGLMPSGANISSLELERSSVTGSTLSLPAGASLKIYLKNEPASSLDLGSATLDWATIISGATLVYNDDPSVPLGNSPGWKMFAFGSGGSAASFNYTGGALVVYADYSHTTAIGGSTALGMVYATNAQGTPTPNTWSTYTIKYTNTSTGTPPTTIATNNSSHPHVRFTYSSGPCSTPPTPGATTATPNTGLCVGQNINLGLSGNSTGSSQTYEFEESTSFGGPYTPISGTLTSPSFSVAASSTKYYRCAVTCSGNTQYSTPQQVLVNTPFPGGTYTINSAVATGGSNFQSFTDAVSAISCGISGAVTFNVVPGSGPYTEQISLPASIGATSINTVTFNGNGETIRFASTNTNARHVIQLNGADYITFDNLVVVPNYTGATYGWGFHFFNGADYNTINNCTINNDIINTTSTNFACVVMSGSATSALTSGNNGNNNTISNSTLIGGYYGMTLYGNSTAGSENLNNKVENCTIQGFYSYAIYMLGQKGAIIRGNDFSRPTRTNSTTTAAVAMFGGCLNTLVEKNRVHNMFTSVTAPTSTNYSFYLSCAY